MTRIPEQIAHLARHLLISKARIHRAGPTLKEKGVASIHVAHVTTHVQLTGHGDRLSAPLT